MNYPTIKPQHYDPRTTAVPQEDGSLALFVWEDEQWNFKHYVDSNRFRILKEEEQTGEYAKYLIQHEVIDHPAVIPENILKENETLHAYRYGGVMSLRWGWYITPSNDPNRVLKVKLMRMS